MILSAKPIQTYANIELATDWISGTILGASLLQQNIPQNVPEVHLSSAKPDQDFSFNPLSTSLSNLLILKV